MSVKVLFQLRRDVYLGSGGDLVQAKKTAEALREQGVDVSITNEVYPELHGFDLVHLFSLNTFRQAEYLYRRRMPFVVSTIFWDTANYVDRAVGGVGYRGFVKRLIYSVPPLYRSMLAIRDIGALREIAFRERLQIIWDRDKYKAHSPKSLYSKEIEWARLLLPNARAEVECLFKFTGLRRPYIVVPNAADLRFAQADAKPFIEKYGMRDFVLCVAARFNERKNQLRLIEALKGTRIPLVLIGDTFGRHEAIYLERCRNAADRNVIFLPRMQHEDLPSVYAAAKVHVLPSWYETPGLVSLEAALAGCNIVTTQEGTAKEYFGDFAFYCDPGDVDSIRNAVLRAYYSPRNDNLRKFVMDNYTWERAAYATLRAYQMVLAGDLSSALR